MYFKTHIRQLDFLAWNQMCCLKQTVGGTRALTRKLSNHCTQEKRNH